MRQSASAELAFSSIFRQEAATAVEYSYDARPHEHGVMVRGGAGFPAQVKSLAASLPFAGDWISVLARLIQAIDPDAYLLRTDWSSSRITAVTAYCRFPAEPDDAGLAAVTSHAWPLIWQGPAAGHVARILGVSGPRGLGVGVDHAGQLDLALYFRAPGLNQDLSAECLTALGNAAGMAPGAIPALRADLERLYTHGMPIIVGLDSAVGSRGPALKFNPPNVPLESFIRFLRDHGTDPHRLRTLVRVAHALRTRWISYLGIRYSDHGFAGWRMYYSVAPQRFPGSAAPRWAIEAEAVPTLILPHY